MLVNRAENYIEINNVFSKATDSVDNIHYPPVCLSFETSKVNLLVIQCA